MPEQQKGIFMGTASEKAIIESNFSIRFSSDSKLWRTNDFSPLVDERAPYHIVTKCQSTNEDFNAFLTQGVAAVIDYEGSSYPEYFVPRDDWNTSPSFGKHLEVAPHHVWFVRGYVDSRTRVVQRKAADEKDGLDLDVCLVTLVDIQKRSGGGAEAVLSYKRPGFEFTVTVAPESNKVVST